MDQNIYKNLLKDDMLSYACNKMPRGWMFQQASNPKLISKMVMILFTAKKIIVLDWPS